MASTLMGLTLLVPIVGAIAVIFVNSSRVRRFAGGVALVTTLLAIWLAVLQYGNPPIEVAWSWIGGLGIDFEFHLDGLASILMVAAAALSASAILFMPHEYKGQEVEQSSFYGWMLVFLAAMIGVALAANTVQFYLFWEALLIPSTAMLAFWGDLENRGKIALKYFVYTHVGAVLILLAILWVYSTTGVTDIYAFRETLASVDSSILRVLIWLFVLGFGFKLAMFPFHSWLPDTYEASPLPLAIAMAGGMMGCGIYGIIRFVFTPFPAEIVAELAFPIMILALITLYYGGIMAFAQKNLRRFLAYSSMSQMGYVLLGIGSAHGLGVGGATFHILNHGVAKVLMFMVVAVLIYRTGKNRLDELGGLATTMPVTALCATVGAFSLAGAPPFSGFHSEWMIFAGVYSQGHLVLAVLAIAGAVLSSAYALSFVRYAFFGHPKESLQDVKEVPLKILAPMLVLALVAVIVGVYPAPFFEWVTGALGPLHLGI
ncbi:MAG: complex I subunit 4 family protein [Bacillota bacterium]